MENLLQNKIVLLGPYVGNIKEELFTFKPFVDWFKRHFKYRNLFISTHYDRSFLYKDKNVPIFKQYTHDVLNQFNHTHKQINSYDYQVIKKSVIEDILSISSYKKSDIITYDLGYSFYSNICFTQRIFLPLDLIPVKKHKFLFVPDNSRKWKENLSVYRFLSDISDINIIDFNLMSYEEIIRQVLGSEIIITPASHWTLLCNLHNKNVFSWGKNISVFKSYYNFDNEKCILYKTENKLEAGFWKFLKSFVERFT